MALVAGLAPAAAARSPRILVLLLSPRRSSSSHAPNLRCFHPWLRSPLSPFPHKPIKSSKINGVSWEGRGEGGGEEEMEGVVMGSDGGEGESEEEDEESGLELLVQFLQSLLRRVSRSATKAARSVLPPVISPQLVSFSVDGILLLAVISMVKALLEVLCTLGGSIFIIILLLRVIWTLLLHFQSSSHDVNKGRSGTYNTA